MHTVGVADRWHCSVLTDLLVRCEHIFDRSKIQILITLDLCCCRVAYLNIVACLSIIIFRWTFNVRDQDIDIFNP